VNGPVLPWIILAAVAVPVLIAAFVVSRRRTVSGEHPAGETAADQARIEDEFAAAEAYQEKWRAEEQDKNPPESLY
jgi:hypothetical protein